MKICYVARVLHPGGFYESHEMATEAEMREWARSRFGHNYKALKVTIDARGKPVYEELPSMGGADFGPPL